MPGLVDVVVDERTEDLVRGHLRIEDRHKQPLGLVHGGIYAIVAEALTVDGGRAISNQASFVRPVTGGTIHAVARRRHRGRTTAVWEVDITDDQGRLCALVRVTSADRRS